MNAPTSRAWLRAAAQRLTLGSRRIAVHLTRRITAWIRDTWARTMAWLSDATGIAWAVRLCVLLAAAWILRQVGLAVVGAAARRLDTSAWLLWPTAGVWIIAAWRAGHPDWQPRTAPAAAAGEAPEPQPDPAPVSLAKPAAGHSLDDALDAARRLGTPHCHLAVIDDALDAPPGTARGLFTAAGIPISDVRMRGRGTSTGVRGRDIPPLSSPSPEGDATVVGAGQGANNDNNNNRLRVREEAGMTIILDPSERRAYTV